LTSYLDAAPSELALSFAYYYKHWAPPEPKNWPNSSRSVEDRRLPCVESVPNYSRQTKAAPSAAYDGENGPRRPKLVLLLPPDT
jgi:hypothetical protein